MHEVREKLWKVAFSASWNWCEERAKEFIKDNWGINDEVTEQQVGAHSNTPTFYS
jgi:hypothetical protein